MNQKLRYGTMKIFHAYESDSASGRVLFSVTSALEPGYFDADHIDTIKIPGLCLFMHHHSLPQPLKTFEEMLKVAKRLEHLLGGTLCDSQRQPLSETIIADYRAKLSSLGNIKDRHG
jgi:cell division protein ZipA